MVDGNDLYVVDEFEGDHLHKYDGVDNSGLGVFDNVDVVKAEVSANDQLVEWTYEKLTSDLPCSFENVARVEHARDTQFEHPTIDNERAGFAEPSTFESATFDESSTFEGATGVEDLGNTQFEHLRVDKQGTTFDEPPIFDCDTEETMLKMLGFLIHLLNLML